MIEQGIYFALGCIVTALAALMFAPVFWRRALRLSRQRLQLQIPLSMQEIFAERDQLRAEFAVDRLRIEQELERVRAGKAGDMAEIGRRSMEATRLTEQLAALRQVEQAYVADIERLSREIAERDETIGSLTAELHGERGILGRLRKDSDAAAYEASSSRALSVELQAVQAKMSAEIEGLKIELQNALTFAERLQQDSGAGSRHLSTDQDQAAEQVLAAKSHASALEKELAVAVAALAEAREREKSHHLRSSMKAERSRSDDRVTTARLEALQAENEALQNALNAARRAPPANAGSASAGAANDGGLRESIHALGLAVAAMTRETRRPGANETASKGEAQPVA